MKWIPIKAKPNVLITGAFFAALLFLSSVTFVPQIHGETFTQRLDEIERLKTTSPELLREYNEAVCKSIYLLNVFLQELIQNHNNPGTDINLTKLQWETDHLLKSDISSLDSYSIIQETYNALYSTLNQPLSQPTDIHQGETRLPQALHQFVSKIQHYINKDSTHPSNIASGKTSIKGSLSLNAQAGLSIWALLILLIVFLVEGGLLVLAIGGLMGILSGGIFIVGAIISIIALFFAGVQSLLILTGFFIFLLAFFSRIIIKVFTIVGSPIFGFIVTKVANLIGSILGRLSFAILTGAAILVIFALPLIIILLLLSSGGQNGNDSPPILASLLTLLFSVLINIPALEDYLRQVWDWFAERNDDWPEWPFDNPS